MCRKYGGRRATGLILAAAMLMGLTACGGREPVAEVETSAEETGAGGSEGAGAGPGEGASEGAGAEAGEEIPENADAGSNAERNSVYSVTEENDNPELAMVQIGRAHV